MMARRDVRRRLEEVTGRRVETVEWARRSTQDTYRRVAGVGYRKGEIIPARDEDHARAMAQASNALPEGCQAWQWMQATELVHRTVVTYTTTWETVPDPDKVLF